MKNMMFIVYIMYTYSFKIDHNSGVDVSVSIKIMLDRHTSFFFNLSLKK